MHHIITSLILLIITLPAIASKKPANIVGIKAIKVQTVDLFDIFYAVGLCKNDNSRDYYAQIAGQVEVVSSKQGGMVNKGELLLVIDRNIAETVKSNAESLFNLKQDMYTRNKSLFAKKIISIEALEKSNNEFENAKLDYYKALKTYNDMIITAPFCGRIGVIKPKVGDNIKQGEFLFSIIADEGVKSIFIELPEFLNGKVLNNTKVIVSDNNDTKKIQAKISSVSEYLSNTGTIDAKIILPPNNNIIHNSYVDVMIIINPHKNLALPEQCIQRNNRGNFIYKINDNIVQQLYVKLGSRTNGLVEVISQDIREGDKVVIEGMTKINDGSEVKLL